MFSFRSGFHVRGVAAAVSLVVLASCGGGSGGGGGGVGFVPLLPAAPAPAQPDAPAPAPAPTHTVGGKLSGLAGGRVVLQNNAGDDLAVAADGSFTFTAGVTEGAAYAVTVRTQPLWQFCKVSGGSGTAAAEVSGVTVDCAAAVGLVSTLAGNGVQADVDGTGAAASFMAPVAVAVGADGGLYVADGVARKIRSVSAAGSVTAFAGNGAPLSVDGPAGVASFLAPSGVAIDAGGNLFVTDASSATIRKVTPSAAVSTVAGSSPGGAPVDGNGTGARFTQPQSLVLDAAGNVYISDFFGNTVRKMTPAFDVTTLAGSGALGSVDGPGAAASFNRPAGVAVDAAGNVYVAEMGANAIRKITPAGDVSTLAGTPGVPGFSDGVGAAASFFQPVGIAVDADGTVYVADSGFGLIRRITPAGAVTTIAGKVPGLPGAVDGIGGAASFRTPSGLAVDAAGNLYVTDTNNYKIRKITPVAAP